MNGPMFYNAYLTLDNQENRLNILPQGFGVSRRSSTILLIFIWSFALLFIITFLVVPFIATRSFNYEVILPIVFFTAVATISINRLQSYRINIQREKYFLTVLAPYIKNVFGLNFQPFDLNRLVDGLALPVKNNSAVVFVRYSTKGEQFYLSEEESLNTLVSDATVRTVFPRSSIRNSKISSKNLPENAFIQTVIAEDEQGEAFTYFVSDYNSYG